MSDDTETVLVKMPGHIRFKLIASIVNPNPEDGPVVEYDVSFDKDYTMSRSATTEALRRLDSTLSFSLRHTAGVKWKVVDFKSESKFDGNISEHTQDINTTSTTETLTVKDHRSLKVPVAGGVHAKVYQLVLDSAAGTTQTFVPVVVPGDAPPPVTIGFELTIRVSVPAHGGPLPAGRYAIKSAHHGTWIRGHAGGEGSSVDMQTAVGPWEQWTLVKAPEGKYGIRSCHGTYMRAHGGGEGATLDLQVDKHDWEKMLWEQFVIVPVPGTDRYGIRSYHGTYLRAHGGGEGATLDLQVDKHDWEKMLWEQFHFETV